jgi:hypothetical protein
MLILSVFIGAGFGKFAPDYIGFGLLLMAIAAIFFAR